MSHPLVLAGLLIFAALLCVYLIIKSEIDDRQDKEDEIELAEYETFMSIVREK